MTGSPPLLPPFAYLAAARSDVDLPAVALCDAALTVVHGAEPLDVPPGYNMEALDVSVGSWFGRLVLATTASQKAATDFIAARARAAALPARPDSADAGGGGAGGAAPGVSSAAEDAAVLAARRRADERRLQVCPPHPFARRALC